MLELPGHTVLTRKVCVVGYRHSPQGADAVVAQVQGCKVWLQETQAHTDTDTMPYATVRVMPLGCSPLTMLAMCCVEVSRLKERLRAVTLAAAEDSEADSLRMHLPLASHSLRPCTHRGRCRHKQV